MGREENVMVFEDTMRLCKENGKIKAATEQSKNNQKLILENDLLMLTKRDTYKESAKIVVSKKRSFEAAVAYKGQKVCVHNFASATNPGGGVERGANAQEECLCRCSNLYPCLKTSKFWEEFYKPHRAAQNPIHNDDIIYTPSVIVFKSDTANPNLLPEKEWYEVNVITCAAPNLRKYPSNAYNSGDGNKSVRVTDNELKEIHEKRLRRILDVTYAEGNEVVVLGAFGCGAFANKPEMVATAAKNVISEYQHMFKVIEFAVYCNSWDEENYEVFKRVL